ncbi:hypothetical protein Tco_0314532, partial [Tanacetum coccineum]
NLNLTNSVKRQTFFIFNSPSVLDKIPPPDGRRHPSRVPQARPHGCTAPKPALPAELPFSP